MFSLTIFVLSSLSSLICASDYLLILDHKDVANGYFSTDLKTDGLENENDATANTYSIIGNFNDDAALQRQYKDDDGKFTFKLIYRYDDGTNDTLIWRQSSWIADENVTGADLSQIPDQSGKEVAAQFYGLALSSYSATYIDGTGGEYEWWFHSVGSNTQWGGGIPGDRRYEAAYSSSLYIFMPAETATEAPVNCGYELILEHKDTASGYFDTSIRSTGLENEDDPTANTYSIIGNLNATEYLDNNGDYLFKMIYYNDDDAISGGSPENYTLIWKQSSWLTQTGVQGYQGISIPELTNSRAAQYFYFVGLSLSSYSSYVYLDGIPSGISSYRNAAGYFGTSNANIPAYNHVFATGQQLFIWNDKDCVTTQPPTTGAPTSETTTNAGTTKDTTTESPIIEPSILPTADPTTSEPTTAAPTTPQPTIADDCVLIMEHKDIADGYFSADLKDTGLENENDPTANTYSIIGLFNDDEDLRDEYKDDDGNYKFKLIYGYDDDTTDTFIWTQKSWITDVNISGANLTQIPDQSGKHSAAWFYGLALSNSDRAYLDGTGTQVGIWWFHAIGSNTAWLGGIPADRWNYPAQNSSLCIYQPPTSTDCSILDIDAYLTDCSVVFQTNELEDEAMEQEIESLDERVTTIEQQIEQCGCSSSSASGSARTFIDDKSPSVGTNLLSNESKDTLIIALVLINICTIIGGCYLCLLFYTKSPRVEFMKYDKVDVHYQEETETEEN